jgi:hypothetical protein
MSNSVIDISNVINVSVTSAGVELGVPNINTAALFSQETPTGWGSGQTYGVYKTASDVATDFGSTSSAFAIATNFFAQNPNPLLTGGYLVVVPRETSSSETTQAAILRTKDTIYYYGILIDEEMSNATAFANLCAYVQSIDKMFFYATSDITQLTTGSMCDLVRSAGQTSCRMLYYGVTLYNGANTKQTQMFASAYAGRALSVDFSGSKTAATMNLKQLQNIVSDTTMNQTYLTQAQAAGIDVYVNIGGVAGLFTSGMNEFFDYVYNLKWVKFALQTYGFNYLAGTNTKIPQTEDGMNGLKDAYRQACTQAVTAGVSAPGSWTSPDTFGDPVSLRRNIEKIGFYIYSAPVADQSSTDRAARNAPLIQIALKLAGAIHSSSVIVNVNE